MKVLSKLAETGFSSYLPGPSALHIYFHNSPSPFLWVETEASLIDLSRMFDGLIFPGSAYFDAALDTGEGMVLFHCIDAPVEKLPLLATLQGRFWYDLRRRVFRDPFDAYRTVRGGELRPVPEQDPEDGTLLETAYAGIPKPLRRWYVTAETALLTSAFGYIPDTGLISTVGQDFGPEEKTEERMIKKAGAAGNRTAGNRADLLTTVEQRFLLSAVLVGPHAAKGLSVLMKSGYIDAHWPLLAEMNEVDHSKEHHPEGNVWKHTMETFSHRKVYDLPLSLALLLHDCGKSSSNEENGNRFDRHAQIGAHQARRFLSDLEFSPELTGSVEFLVRNHMIPGAVSRLPLYRTEDIMASPLFPDLLELYRCDISSTFRGPEGYYQACRTYRGYLKNSRNPFRSSDGKKRFRLLVE